MEKIPKLINIGPMFIPYYRVGTLNLEMDTIWRKEHTLERDMDWKRHSRMNKGLALEEGLTLERAH